MPEEKRFDMPRPHVKICCIGSTAEAFAAIGHGASALGLVGRMPSGPGVIGDPLIREIAAAVPPSVATFLLTSETEADAVVAHHRKVNTSTIQIVDALDGRRYQRIRDALPDVRLVQVIHVIDEGSIREAEEVSPFVDAILLDSGNPNLAVKELGGTGRTHDWRLSASIRERIDIPVYLAGGLNKNNVLQAVEAVQPFGIDLCSGVRTGGKLDEAKLEAFFKALERC